MQELWEGVGYIPSHIYTTCVELGREIVKICFHFWAYQLLWGHRRGSWGFHEDGETWRKLVWAKSLPMEEWTGMLYVGGEYFPLSWNQVGDASMCPFSYFLVRGRLIIVPEKIWPWHTPVWSQRTRKVHWEETATASVLGKDVCVLPILGKELA